MNDADASHFFHLLSFEGEALAPAPPKMTTREKWAFLADDTKRAGMTPPTVADYRHARSERLSKVIESTELVGCIR